MLHTDEGVDFSISIPWKKQYLVVIIHGFCKLVRNFLMIICYFKDKDYWPVNRCGSGKTGQRQIAKNIKPHRCLPVCFQTNLVCVIFSVSASYFTSRSLDLKHWSHWAPLCFSFPGVGAASSAKLTFMVGGAEEEFTAAKELLSCMGANVVYCGQVGTGQVRAALLHLHIRNQIITLINVRWVCLIPGC